MVNCNLRGEIGRHDNPGNNGSMASFSYGL